MKQDAIPYQRPQNETDIGQKGSVRRMIKNKCEQIEFKTSDWLLLEECEFSDSLPMK